MRDPYRTMDPEYVESVWWALKQIHGKGLLGRGLPGRAVLPALRHRALRPRARPGLRDGHRPLGLRAASRSPPARTPATGASLLVWTTTPWTLVSNALVAAHPEMTYVTASNGEETLVVAESLVEKALGEGWTVGDRSPAPTWSAGPTSARSSWSSGRPRTETATGPTRTSWSTRTTSPPRTAPGWCTSPPPSVRTTSSPAGATASRWSTRSTGPGHFYDDVAAGRRAVLPARQHRPGRGPGPSAACCSGTCPTSTATRTAGAATPRCSTTPSRRGTSAPPQIKDALLAGERETNWYPATIKHGRYGDWLENNIDWALSRSRYWGTPLPIWRCAEDHQTCVGSLAELSELTGADQSALDPHRPFVDEVTFACPTCGAAGPAGARGDRRLVRLRLDAVRPVGIPARRAPPSCSSGPTRPTSSARRSTRPGAGSTR